MMLLFSIVFFIVYLGLLGTIAFIGFFRQIKKEKKYVTEKEINLKLDEITVLIPFRNEEHRLQGLLESINHSSFLPKQFIFIDDHSSDNSAALIRSKIENVPFQIFSLPENVTGKKRALRYAIEQVSTMYILTLDADVYFDENYFDALTTLQESDMYILPAIMIAKKPIEYLYEVDLILVNALNVGLSGVLRPIICSGANLLYRKEVFDEVDNLASHIHQASGDDTYLLRDFRENEKDVRLISSLSYAVKTETPQSFREFINQRLRWIGKTGDLKDHLSTSLAIIQSILTICFFSALVFTIIQSQWNVFAFLFILKTLFDMLIFAPYFFRINRKIAWIMIPMYELLFPVYTLIMLSLVFVYRPKWKGRGIKN